MVSAFAYRLADVLPKHWGGPVGGAEVAEQLAGKKLSHDSLLLILGNAGVLSQLTASALRSADLRQIQIQIQHSPRYCPSGLMFLPLYTVQF